MFSVGHADFFCFCPVPGRDQVTVIGESCSEKGPAVDIVRTYLQAQTAFQALCRAVLMPVVAAGNGLVFADVYVRPRKVLMYG